MYMTSHAICMINNTILYKYCINCNNVHDQLSSTEHREATYWDKRYMVTAGESYDWYMKYPRLSEALHRSIPHGTSKDRLRILQIGVGNSLLQENMMLDGWATGPDGVFENVDISAVAILQQQDRAEELHLPSALRYRTADCRNLDMYPDASFDLIIDKGTVDAICCGSNSTRNVRATLNECARLLRPGGQLIMITYGKPETRLFHLARPRFGWEVTMALLEKRLEKHAPADFVPRFCGPYPVSVASVEAMRRVVRGELKDCHYVYYCRRLAPGEANVLESMGPLEFAEDPEEDVLDPEGSPGESESEDGTTEGSGSEERALETDQESDAEMVSDDGHREGGARSSPSQSMRSSESGASELRDGGESDRDGAGRSPTRDHHGA